MKKLSMVFLGLATITLVTGCGGNGSEKTLVCTNTDKSVDGMEIGSTVSMTFKKDKMNHIKMDVSTRLTGDEAKDMWSAFVESMDSQTEATDKDGIKTKITKNEKNYEYILTLDVDVEKASKEDLETYGLSDLTSDNGTLEENKKSAEADGFTCKVK